MAAAMGSFGGHIVTTSSASLNAFSPISNLERQYEGPLGQRVILGVQVNAACCLEGGVEAILKLKGTNGPLSTETAPTPNFDESKEDDFDAFGFLQESESNANAATQAETSRTNRFGGFIRKVAASTSATLERQMQGLAVRIDKGRNPDLLRVAMYDAFTDELLGVTDAAPVEERRDIRFNVPLVVSGRRRQQQFRLKLWLQSGAVLLQSTNVAKNYLLGHATVDCASLVPGTVTSISLSSNLVVGAHIQVCAMKDPKFSQILQRSWSVTDPDMSGYSSELFNLPVDQSYVFGGKQPDHWLVASERATESAVVLPIAAAMMELAAKATQKSLHHATSVCNVLRNSRHDFKDETKATCSVDVIGIQSPSTTATVAGLTVAWRRPDSIFELELVANEAVPISPTPMAAANPPVQFKLYPKVCTDGILPGILQVFGGQMPASGFLLGALAFSVNVQGPDTKNLVEIWETVTGMEGFITATNGVVQLPLQCDGRLVGHLMVHIVVTMPAQPYAQPVHSAADGLVSLVGLESLSYGVNPLMDNDAPLGQELSLRKSQLDTLGLFFTTQYMDQHLALRQSAMEGFQERARLYRQALAQPIKSEPHATRTPKAFRPSSSRMETSLSALPFNCHVVQLNLEVVDAFRTVPEGQEHPGACFQNITHGAPSDHARGFGNVLAGVSNVTAAGGLRRLEARRQELSQMLQEAQSKLIEGVGGYIGAARRSGGNINHVPARHAELQQLRWRVFEAVHSLHHVTWMCAVRRANCFSQSLGLAVTSYLTSLSDTSKLNAGWPDIWQRHGYMVCFEGLLSAAGKELGMIEDARYVSTSSMLSDVISLLMNRVPAFDSIAISMLRMVRIVLMPDKGIPSKAVFVPSVPYLKWVNLFPSGQGQNRHFLLQIGVDPAYYNERIPVPLRNGIAVQLYPVLYQVGVDVRQWGAHAGNKLLSKQPNGTTQEVSAGRLVDDDDDDDVGIVDNDVLVALNFEAFQKMNVYSHAIRPQQVTLDKIQTAMLQVFAVRASLKEDQQVLPIHETMSTLFSHIKSSSGRMNHSILDEAATLVQHLGGGALVFCKSGKDRTAMHGKFGQSLFSAK